MQKSKKIIKKKSPKNKRKIVKKTLKKKKAARVLTPQLKEKIQQLLKRLEVI